MDRNFILSPLNIIHRTHTAIDGKRRTVSSNIIDAAAQFARITMATTMKSHRKVTIWNIPWDMSPEILNDSNQTSDVSGDFSGVHGNSLGVYPETFGVHPETLGVYPETFGVYPETLGLYPETLGVNPETLRIHSEILGIHPETLRIHPETLGIHSAISSFGVVSHYASSFGGAGGFPASQQVSASRRLAFSSGVTRRYAKRILKNLNRPGNYPQKLKN
jgi:hypothetical protein